MSIEPDGPNPVISVPTLAGSVFENVTCLACGCLCDDLQVTVEENRVVAIEPACSIAQPWFLSRRPDQTFPAVSIDDRPAELAQALDRAAEILRNAKSPFVWGLTETTVESVASALAIADQIGACVDLASADDQHSKQQAFHRVGQVSATLGEVKDRADLVLFWDVDPLNSHPRHWERYSVEPKGRFIPEGRAGRFVIVVDGQPSTTSLEADLFVKIDRKRQHETLRVLGAIVKGIEIDPDRASRSTGISFVSLQNLANQLKRARYGAIFFEPSYGASEPILELTRDLNDARRFVALEMGSGQNATGAASVLSWQAGAASAIDYGLGYPRHLPREASLRLRLEEGTVDAVLMVARHGWMALGSGLLRKLNQIPTIVIGAKLNYPARTSVSFETTRPGIESGGTVARSDGVMLPLRPVISSDLPTDRQILEAIRERLEKT